MTAEIAILNKTAIALAADSAVTIEQQRGPKIYNTVNKLFALSKHCPVGIMVYGNADFMEIPWELIIKIYREQLGAKSFERLKDYAGDFIAFLESNEELFPQDLQERYCNTTIVGYFNSIRAEINKHVKSKIDDEGKIQISQVEEIVSLLIKKHYEQWNNSTPLPLIPPNHSREVVEKFEKIIEKARGDVFQKLPISDDSKEQLRQICGNLFSKDVFFRNTSGVVFAGFGKKDIFPVITSFLVEGVVNWRLKHRELREKSADISIDKKAVIIPFAQDHVVATFIEGVDPLFDSFLQSYLTELFNKYPDTLVGNISSLSNNEKQSLTDSLKKIGNEMLKEFNEQKKIFIGRTNVRPIIKAVGVLPKDELAIMAETLVNLTSFKQRISAEAETVGGPIDVAVISKGDGFIWIKRKHYFKPELNPSFFENYFKQIEDKMEEKNAH